MAAEHQTIAMFLMNLYRAGTSCISWSQIHWKSNTNKMILKSAHQYYIWIDIYE